METTVVYLISVGIASLCAIVLINIAEAIYVAFKD